MHDKVKDIATLDRVCEIHLMILEKFENCIFTLFDLKIIKWKYSSCVECARFSFEPILPFIALPKYLNGLSPGPGTGISLDILVFNLCSFFLISKPIKCSHSRVNVVMFPS